MRFLLDTNVIIDALNGTRNKTFETMRKHRTEEIATSSIVIHELFYGAYKSERQSRNLALLEALQFPILNFDSEDAREAGKVRAQLAAEGKPIGPYDVLIAGQAFRRRLTLVTANVREFSRIRGLTCENWSR